MKIELLFVVETSVGRVPCQSGTWYFWRDMGPFWQIQAIFVVKQPLCDVEVSFGALITSLGRGHLMKTECLVVKVTPVESPDRANVTF